MPSAANGERCSEEGIFVSMTTSHKICTKCGQDKPLSEYYVNRAMQDDIHHLCKDCSKRATRAYYAAHKDEILARQREYRRTHQEKIKTYQAAYRANNPDRVRALQKAWCSTHKGHLKRYQKRYDQEHKKERNAREKGYRQTPAGKARNARSKAKKRMRRLQTDAAVKLTAKQWQARIAEYDSRCCWCGKELVKEEIVMDHIVALANGGAHAASNVAPSCWDCNASKHTRDWGYPLPGVYTRGKSGNIQSGLRDSDG